MINQEQKIARSAAILPCASWTQMLKTRRDDRVPWPATARISNQQRVRKQPAFSEGHRMSRRRGLAVFSLYFTAGLQLSSLPGSRLIPPPRHRLAEKDSKLGEVCRAGCCLKSAPARRNGSNKSPGSTGNRSFHAAHERFFGRSSI